MDLRRVELWKFGVVRARGWELVDLRRWAREEEEPFDGEQRTEVLGWKWKWEADGGLRAK